MQDQFDLKKLVQLFHIKLQSKTQEYIAYHFPECRPLKRGLLVQDLPKNLHLKFIPISSKKTVNARYSGGDGGRYQGPLGEIAEGNDFPGADLCGEVRSNEAKAAAGEYLRAVGMNREKGVVGKEGNCQFSLLPRPTQSLVCPSER